MLLGVCLVVSGDFGNRLLFRYPPLKLHTAHSAQPQQQPSTTAAPHKDTANNASTSGRPVSTTAASSSSPPSQTYSITSLSLPPTAARTTARITSTGPITDTAALQRLNDLDDLDPDDIPPPLPPAVLAQAAANNPAARRQSLHSSQPITASLLSSTTAGPLGASASLSGVSSAALPLSDKEDIWGMPLYEFTRLFSPLSSHLASSLLDVAVNAVRFLSFPIRLPSESRHEMTMFNVVLVLKANTNFTLCHSSPSQPSTHSAQPVASLLLQLYSAILIQLSRALEHEQKRCGFLSYHSSLMTQLRDRYIRTLQTGAEGEKGGLAAMLVRESLLAEHLYRLHKGLVRLERHYYVEEGKRGEVHESGEKPRRRPKKNHKANSDTLTHVHLLVNDWWDNIHTQPAEHLPHSRLLFSDCHSAAYSDCLLCALRHSARLHLHCTLAPSAIPRPQPPASTSSLVATTAASAPLSIRPYQTLLLTTSKQSLLDSLPPDSSPVLARVIAHINPTYSFLSLASSLSLPLSSLLLLAHHLVQWGKARVIDTLQDTDTFVVSSSSPPLTASLQSSFASTFPASSLPVFLSSLHPPRPLSEHLSRLSAAGKQHLMKQLVWTLERGLLNKLDTVLLYRSAHAASNVAGGDKEADSAGGRLSGDRSEWSAAEWVAHLSQYGDGKHTLTEIAWLERAYLTRDELMRLFSQHEDELLCIQLQPT